MKSNMLDLSNEFKQSNLDLSNEFKQMNLSNEFATISEDMLTKKTFRIIPRDQWANEELKPNITDLIQLEKPVQAGVIAHHSGKIENRCFTIGIVRM